MLLSRKGLKREAGVIPAQVRCCEYGASSKNHWETGKVSEAG